MNATKIFEERRIADFIVSRLLCTLRVETPAREGIGLAADARERPVLLGLIYSPRRSCFLDISPDGVVGEVLLSGFGRVV
jgi:hypothetical protein